MAKGLFNTLKGIDAFGKTTEDVKVKTRTGAFLTLLSFAIILTFTMMEFVDYRSVTVDTSISVDKSRGERLSVNLNVTFPRVPCYLLSLDVMDISGETQRDISHNVKKTRLDDRGVAIAGGASGDLKNPLDKMNNQKGDDYCGSCYGGVEPASGCCNNCEEVRTAYVNRGWSFNNPEAIEQCRDEGWADKLKDQANEGCNVAGRVRVNKVIGNIHLSPGRSFQASGRNYYELVPYLRDDGKQHDFSHTIHEFKFQSDDDYNTRKSKSAKALRERMGLDSNPLDGTTGRTTKPAYMFQYFLKVVGTQFNTLDGKMAKSHQYSSTSFERDLTKGSKGQTNQGVQVMHGVTGVPGAFFNYEISPLLVSYTETRQSFAHFVTSTCAIVGGVLTVAAILDSVLFATTRVIKKSGHGGGMNGNGYGSKLM